MSYLTDMLAKIPVQFQKEWIEPSITINAPTASQEIMLNTDFTCSGIAPAFRVNIIAISSVGDRTTLASALVVASTLFSKTDCQLPSTDFNIGETVIIRVEDYNDTSIYSTVSVTTKATITGLTTNPVSPTEATNFEFSGDADGLNGETLTLESSTDEVTWNSVGTATVTAGTWAKADCQIASEGSYYLRARYGTSVISSSLSVTVASAGFEKLQIGSYYDTTAMTDVNAINQIDDVVYDSDENCYFVAGRTQQDNFYNSGDTVPSFDRPYFMRVETSGDVTWCRQLDCTPQYQLLDNGKLKIISEKVYFTCNVNANSGANPNRVVARIEKDGTGLISNNEGSSYRGDRIVGVQGTDLVLVGTTTGNLTSFRKIDSGLVSFGNISTGTNKSAAGGSPFITRMLSDGSIAMASLPSGYQIDLWSVPYSSSNYQLDSATSILNNTFANLFGRFYGFSQDLSFANVYGDDGAGFVASLLDGTGLTTIGERGEIWDAGDSTDYYILTWTKFMKFTATGKSIVATLAITDIDPDAWMVNTTYDNYDASGNAVLCGYTDGDWTSTGNTTRNGIIWITPLPTV